MRWPRALIFAMNEPGVTCGGPGSGARLDAAGSQGATAVLAAGEADAAGLWVDAGVPLAAGAGGPAGAVHPAATAAAISAASASSAPRRRGRIPVERLPAGCVAAGSPVGWGRKRFIPLASVVSGTRPGGGPGPR